MTSTTNFVNNLLLRCFSVFKHVSGIFDLNIKFPALEIKHFSASWLYNWRGRSFRIKSALYDLPKIMSGLSRECCGYYYASREASIFNQQYMMSRNIIRPISEFSTNQTSLKLNTPKGLAIILAEFYTQ
jgi:hypothetical protein